MGTEWTIIRNDGKYINLEKRGEWSNKAFILWEFLREGRHDFRLIADDDSDFSEVMDKYAKEDYEKDNDFKNLSSEELFYTAQELMACANMAMLQVYWAKEREGREKRDKDGA